MCHLGMRRSFQIFLKSLDDCTAEFTCWKLIAYQGFNCGAGLFIPTGTMVTFIEFEFGADVRNAISVRCMSYWDEVARKCWNERHFYSLHAQEGYYLLN